MIKNKPIIPILIGFITIFLLVLAVKGDRGNPIYFQSELDGRLGGPFESTGSNSRFVLTWAIVEQRTIFFDIGLARFAAPDLVKYHGKYFSAFLPGVSFLGVPFYWLGKLIGLPQLITYSLTMVLALINAALVAKIARKFGVDTLTSWLSGLIFLNEVRRLIKHVSSISGVSEVDNQLEEHSSDDHIPGLQGGYYKPGERLDILQTNWAPSTRVFAGFFGTSLLGLGIRRGGLLGALSVMTGTVLGTRAITNKPAKTLFSLLGRKAVHIRRTIRISVPIDQVFEFFSDPINFRSFMNGLKDVRQIEKHRYLFTSEGVKNSPITWHAVVTDLISNHLIIWKSVRPAMINNWGMIRLHLDGRDQTIVQLQMAHYPPRGLMAEFASRLFGVSTKSNLDQSLDQIRKDLEKGQKRFSLVA